MNELILNGHQSIYSNVIRDSRSLLSTFHFEWFSIVVTKQVVVLYFCLVVAHLSIKDIVLVVLTLTIVNLHKPHN
jgi:hypothetical protein